MSVLDMGKDNQELQPEQGTNRKSFCGVFRPDHALQIDKDSLNLDWIMYRSTLLGFPHKCTAEGELLFPRLDHVEKYVVLCHHTTKCS